MISVTDCVPLNTTASANLNYIQTTMPRIAGFTSTSTYTGATACQVMQSIQYLDGLDRRSTWSKIIIFDLK
jgi:hypothetical protein